MAMMKISKNPRTLTEEDDTAEDVGRNADDQDQGVEIAEEDIVQGGVSLKGDDVIRVVPWNKLVHVIIAFAVTVVNLKLNNRHHCFRCCYHNLAEL